MKWTADFEIQYHDIDMRGNVTPSNTLKYMQEAANRQMLAQGPSYDELLADGKSFVICRLRINYYIPLKAYDKITAYSWACESKNVSFGRQYAITRGEETVAEADSVFALVDVNTGKLLRNDEVTLNYSTDKYVPLDRTLRFRLPRIDFSPVGEHRVLWRECDCNIHMNNTKYPDLLCSYIPEIENKTVRSIGINFLYAAPYNESISVFRGEDNGVYYIRTVREDGKINAEAEIVTEKQR